MSSVAKRKRGKEELIKEKERLCKRILKNLAKEFGIGLPAIMTAVQIYNRWLWYKLQHVTTLPFIQAGKATYTITMAGKDAVTNIISDMSEHIISDPYDAGFCAASLYLDKTTFKEQFQQLLYHAGEHALLEAQTEAKKITEVFMYGIVKPAIDKYFAPLPTILRNIPLIKGPQTPLLMDSLKSSEEVKKLVEPPDSVKITDIAIPLKGDVSIDKAEGKFIQFVETDTEVKAVPSSLQVLVAKTGCELAEWGATTFNLDIPSRCLDVLRKEDDMSVSTIQKNCPRIYQKMETTIHRQVQDLSYKSLRAIERGVKDTQLGMANAANDVMISIPYFITFLIIFSIGYYIYRKTLLRLIKAIRK